ncbi:MAG: hypothetical protein N2170_08275 [Bacteroidia bacterium]|nr:hypothetical protein [Bacteroidia bacterium]
MRLLGEWDLPGHCGPIYALECDYERKSLFSAASDGLIAEWRCLSGRQARAIAHTPSTVYALHWLSAHELLYVGDSTGVVYVLDLKNKTLRRAIKAHQSAVFGIFSHPAESEGWSSGRDGKFIFWHVEESEPFANVYVTSAGLRGFILSPSFRGFWTAGRDGWVYEIDRARKEVVRRVQVDPQLVFSIQLSPLRSSVATGGKSGYLKLWSAEMELLWEEPAHGSALNALAWHPGGRLLATGGRDKQIHVWDVVNRERRLTLQGHQRSVNALLWITPDVLASAGDDGLIKVWHLEGLPA